MQAALLRNIRLYPWYLAFTYESLSHAVWYLYLYSYKGLSLGEMAWLALLGDGIIVLAEVPTGALADRLGRRFSMILGIIAQGLSSLLFIGGEEFWQFWLAMAVCGLGDTLRGGADSALLYDSCLAAGQRDRYRSAIANALFIGQIALVGGTVLGGTLATRIAWELPFWLELGMSAIGLAVVLRMVEPPQSGLSEEEEEEEDDAAAKPQRDSMPPAPLEDRPPETATGAGDIATPLITATAASQASIQRSILLLPALLRLLPLLLFASFFALPTELSHFHLPAELEGQGGFTAERLGLLYALFELLYGLGSKLAGQARAPVLRLALPLVALISLACLACFSLREYWPLALYVAARGLLDFASGYALPLLSDEANRRVPSNVRATALSVLNAAGRLLPLSLLPLSAILAETQGFSAMYLLFSAALLLPLAGSLWWTLRGIRRFAAA